MTRADLTKADDWFDAYGQYAVLFGRLIPTVRTLISIPAGLSEMPVGRFLVYSGIGTAVWTTLLALFGYAVGSRYSELEGWIDPISYGVIALIVAIYVWRVVTFKPRRWEGRRLAARCAGTRTLLFLIRHRLDRGEGLRALLVLERRLHFHESVRDRSR